jgi:hypothetical protein
MTSSDSAIPTAKPAPSRCAQVRHKGGDIAAASISLTIPMPGGESIAGRISSSIHLDP